MRYFIFLFFVLLQSCALFKHNYSSEQEKEQVSNDPVPTETKQVADARNVDSLSVTGIIVPIMSEDDYIYSLPYLSESGYSGIIRSSSFVSQFTGYNFSVLLSAPIQPVTVDSVSLPPAAAIADTNSSLPEKLTPKPTATIQPKPETSITPYIASGVAAISLAVLLFYLAKKSRR
jgi:hypothetical protein